MKSEGTFALTTLKVVRAKVVLLFGLGLKWLRYGPSFTSAALSSVPNKKKKKMLLDRGYKLKGIGQVKDPPFLMLWYKRVPMCKGRAHLAPKTPL